jgi:hypothetical protein
MFEYEKKKKKYIKCECNQKKNTIKNENRIHVKIEEKRRKRSI